jgi:hypothetical protein
VSHHVGQSLAAIVQFGSQVFADAGAVRLDLMTWWHFKASCYRETPPHFSPLCRRTLMQFVALDMSHVATFQRTPTPRISRSARLHSLYTVWTLLARSIIPMGLKR